MQKKQQKNGLVQQLQGKVHQLQRKWHQSNQHEYQSHHVSLVLLNEVQILQLVSIVPGCILISFPLNLILVPSLY